MIGFAQPKREAQRMLSREEWAIMQKQFVQMSDEKMSMLKQIKSLSAELKSKQMLEDRLATINQIQKQEEFQLLSEISEYQNKISSVRESIRQSDDPNRKLTWDEKKLSKKEKTLGEETASLGKFNEVIAKLNERLEKMKQNDTIVDGRLQKTAEVLSKYRSAKSQMKFPSKILMRSFDLESSLRSLSRIICKSKEKIKEMRLSSEGFQKSIDQLSSDIESSTSAIKKSISEAESLINSEGELKSEAEKVVSTLVLVTSALRAAESDRQNEEKAAASTTLKTKEDFEGLSKKLEALKADINEQRQTLEQITLEKGISASKKQALIEQLQRSIKEKITEITQSRSTSQPVVKLISLQEKHWVERQMLSEDYQSILCAHKKVTEAVDTKNKILTEMKKWVVPLQKRPDIKTIEDPLCLLEKLYAIASSENRSYASKVGLATQELEGLESVVALLKSELSH